MIAFLGVFQSLNDVLSFHQIKYVEASPLLLGLTATAAVAPALIFIFRVEKVIDYCGHQNIFAIALVVFSLQFTGKFINNFHAFFFKKKISLRLFFAYQTIN